MRKTRKTRGGGWWWWGEGGSLITLVVPASDAAASFSFAALESPHRRHQGKEIVREAGTRQ